MFGLGDAKGAERGDVLRQVQIGALVTGHRFKDQRGGLVTRNGDGRRPGRSAPQVKHPAAPSWASYVCMRS